MIHEHEATELASAAIDFGLTPDVQRELDHELAECPICAERAAAYREQIRFMQRLPVLDASDRVRRRVTAAATTGRADTRSPMMLALAAALLLAMALGAVGAVGAWLNTRQPDELTRIDPTPFADPTITAPSVEPAPTTAPRASGRPVLAIDSVAQVVATNVRVRSFPSVDEAKSERYEPFLRPGDRLFVVAGPVVADDYDWYHVVPIGGEGSRGADQLPSGWLSVSDHDGTPWVAPAAPECPSDPVDIEALELMAPMARVACYSNRPMDVTAAVQQVSDNGCVGGACGPTPWVGGWAAVSNSVRTGDRGTALSVAIDPDSGMTASDVGTDRIVVLHGSFNRPLDLGCADLGQEASGTARVTPEHLVACKSLFVVDRVTPDPYPISVGRVAGTVTSDLRVRSMPFVGQESAMLNPLLDHGTSVAVVDGPVLASGYTWYEVVVPSERLSDGSPLVGWVAAGKDGEKWLGSSRVTCPTVGDLSVADIDALTRAPEFEGGLACFGSGTPVDGGLLTFQGRVTLTCGDPQASTEDDWLGHGPVEVLIQDDGAALNARPHPDLDLPVQCGDTADGRVYEIEGHFDDPAAAGCRSGPYADPRVNVLRCRSTFVVTGVRPTG
jgi:hypothetical protein